MLKHLSAILALFCASFAFGQTVRPVLQPNQFYTDSNGAACVGCSLYTYVAGTTTPLPTYTDSTGTVLNSNPVIIGVNGIANVWVSTTAYKFILKDTSGAVVWSVDNVESPGGGGGGGTPAPPAFAVQLANSGATAFQADSSITINPSTHVLTAPNFALPSAGTPFGAPVFGPAGAISADAGYAPAWIAASSLQPQSNTMINWINSVHPATCFNQGDSITAANTGGGATVCGLSGGTTGTWATGSTCYAALIDIASGCASVSNPAVGGDTYADLIFRMLNGAFAPAATQLATMQIGTNDMLAGGAGVARNFSPAILTQTPDLVAENRAIEQYMTIAPANWQSGESFCTGGSWSVDSHYAGHHGCKSTTNADTLSTAVFQAPLGGEPVSMLYRVFSPAGGPNSCSANGGTFTVKMMHSSTGSGGPYTQINLNTVGTTTSTANLYFGNITAGSDANNCSTAFSTFFSNSDGIGTLLVAGDWYRLDVTVTSATNAANIVSIIGVGFGNSWNAGDSSTYPIQFWRMNIPDTRDAQQFGVWNQLNADLDASTAADQAGGWTVNRIDSHNWLTGKWADYVSFHHPTDGGHRKLANAALYSQTARMPSIIASSTPQALNANGGTIIGTVALGNASTAMQFNDNSNQVVMAVRNGIVGTGMLWQFDATKTACQTGGCGTAYPPTVSNQFVGPGPNGNGHYLDRIIAWYDSGATSVYAQSTKESFFAAATPTPTRVSWTDSTVVITPPGGGTSGATLPYDRLFAYPATSTLAYTGLQSFTIDGRFITSKAGAVSAPAFSMTGLPFTGGSATGTVPLAYLNQGTAPTTWSTAGTEFGINAPSGFTGNFVDYHLNGGVSVFAVSSTGGLSLAAARKGTFVCTGGGTITISNTNETATSDVIISLNTAGGTITTPPAMKTVTAATGFTVLCGATDTSTYGYNILN